jgi:signal transduction histidine kinase
MKVEMRLFHKALVLVIVPVVCSWIFAAFLFQQLQAAEQEAYREGHSKAITAECNSIVPLLYNAGTSLFGWVHTKQRRFFDNYTQATTEIRTHIATLELLCAEDPDERARMRKIAPLIQEELNLLDKAAIASRANSLSFGANMRLMRKNFESSSNEMLAELKDFAESENAVAASVPGAEERAHSAIISLLVSFMLASSVVAFALVLFFNRSTVSRLQILMQNTSRLTHRQPLLPNVTGTDEIAHLDAVMHDTATALEDAARRKEEITSMVSHDLRTPLMNIQTVLTMMSDGVYGSLSAKATDAAKRAESNTGHLIRLINDLLDLDKLSAGKMPLLLRDTQLEDVFQRTRESLEYFSEDHQVKLDFQSTDAKVRADADRLVQVLTNLVSNAVKFSPPDSTVVVSAAKVDECIEVSVQDNGKGIPAEFLPKLFARFEQAAPDDSMRGTGLGLSIAKAIVESHEGSIGAESEVGKGSRFWFRLPVLALVVIALSGCTKSIDYYGLRCWERACIAGDDAWRQGKPDVAERYYAEATHIAESKNLGSARIDVSRSRATTMEHLSQPIAISDLPAADTVDLGDQAKDLIKQQKYRDASLLLETMLKQAPAADIAQRLKIAYLLGDCYNHLNQFDKTVEVITPIVHEKAAQQDTADFMKAMTVLNSALMTLRQAKP